MLTRLELFGFKSFADRTAFDFAPGITCVVGPNGSGKSNVVDGIKWILGDQSPKSLRGKEMADVIFNGSVGRKPSGFAEATLTFDNTSGLLRIDATEVQIGRRLYRSGESEYLLNGAVVRLKDIKDCLMGTGAGTSAYSIIEQGRVDQILQANPTTRRVVFEEAAGISRFKNRRADAERKLERVSQNLTRLTDIVDEVETQLNATRSQASRATRYRELTQELRDVWFGLAADDYRRHSDTLTQEQSQAVDRSDKQAALTEQLAELEAVKSANEAELAEVDSRLQRQQQQAAEKREIIAACESTIRHQTGRSRELGQEVDALRSERHELNLHVRAIEGEIEDTRERLARFEAALAEQEQSLAARDEMVEQLSEHAAAARARLTASQRELEQLHQARSDQSARVLLIQSQLSDAESALDAARARLERMEELSGAAAGDRDQLREAVHAAQQEHNAVGADVERLETERLRLLDEQGHSEKSLAAMREQRIAWDARIHVLESLERRREGLGIGVREILDRAAQLDEPPWNGIQGCVGDLIDVPLEFAALLEVALGPAAQLVITRDVESLSEYLNSADGLLQGRVGFLPYPPRSGAPAIEGERASPLDLSGEPGVVARADQVVAEAAEISGVAEHLLSRTWIVETLDVARNLADRCAGNVRLVTMQGELIDSDGSLYAGSVPTETSVVSRKSELRQLRLDLRTLDDEIAEQFREMTQLGQNLTGVDDELARARVRRQQSSDRLTEEKLKLSAQEQELDRLLAEMESARANLAKIEARQDELHREQSRLEQESTERREQIDESEQKIRSASAEIEEIEAALNEVRDESKRAQLELAKHEERVSSLRDVQGRLEEDQRRRRRQFQQADERLRGNLASRRSIERQILQAESEIAAHFGAIELLCDAIDEVVAVRQDLVAKRAAQTREEDEIHRQRRQLSDAEHAAELKIREAEHQLSLLQERIEEEFQVDLRELVEQGCSAYQDWLDSQSHNVVDEADGTDEETPEAVEDTTRPEDDYAAVRAEMEEHVQKLRRKIKSMGHVNTEALESLDDLETRYTRLSSQLADLSEAKMALEEIIRRINAESRRMFTETFDSIREHFRELFRRLFGGGEADIVLEDPSDVLECGIDIVARPPGKELRSISLLSGGEKTLTAIALLFAMFKSKPSPYCILDEVDAALDEANVDRYAGILRDFTEMTQFVVITHRKRTMTVANAIYGVTMEQAGISKRMAVRFDDVSDNGEIRTRGAA